MSSVVLAFVEVWLMEKTARRRLGKRQERVSRYWNGPPLVPQIGLSSLAGGFNMEISTIGIDLSKTTFHLIGLSPRGEIVLRRKLSRKQLLIYTANRQQMLIGMEACGGAHYLARALRDQGHDARLMPAQYVKPYVKTNKNDYLDAEAIAEAVQRPTMRFVPIKTDEQLDLQALHRVRDQWVSRRTGLVNQVRAFLLERGIPVKKGRANLQKFLPEALEDEDQ